MQPNNAPTLRKCLHAVILAGLVLSMLLAGNVRPASAREALGSGVDLDAGYISRTPRYDWDSGKQWPSPGEMVTFTAHVINKGSSPSGGFSYEWRMDGQVVKAGTVAAGLAAGGKFNPAFVWSWKTGRHVVTFKVDSTAQVAETYENNNEIKDFTDALSVGFWVEQSVYNKFNSNPNGMGTYSWEDWAQYQILAYNDLLARSKYPRAPNGALTRLRLDKVTLAPNGTLYDLNPQHAPLETETDVQWGFTIDDYLNCPLEQCYGISSSLLHELGHYLFGRVDLYALDVQGGDVGVRDVQGKLIAGTPALPYIAWDVVHYNSRVAELMSSAAPQLEGVAPGTLMLAPTFTKQRFFSDHTIYSLNRDWPMGKRTHRGWSYIYNIPGQSSLKVLDNNDQPIPGVQISIYQAVGGNGTSGAYSQYFDNIPDITGTTNAQGSISLGARPFGNLENYWGLTGGDILVKLVNPVSGQTRYVWVEVIEFNLAYWRGQTTAYTHVIHFPEGPKRLRLSRNQVSFLSLNGARPIPQQIDAALLGEGVDNFLYITQPGASWLKTIPFSDEPTTPFTAGPVTFQVGPGVLPAGTYTTRVEVGVGLGAVDSPQTVTVTLTVAETTQFAFQSSAARDGWILESSEASGRGGTIGAAAATLLAGDDAQDRQYGSVLSFDTSSLPDSAVITGAALKIKGAGAAGTNPFNTHGNLLADVRRGSFAGNIALQGLDFQAAATKNAVLAITNNPVNGWYSKALAASDLVYINKTGPTQFRLRFALDDNDDMGADFLRFYSGNTPTAADRPQLIIQYYVP